MSWNYPSESSFILDINNDPSESSFILDINNYPSESSFILDINKLAYNVQYLIGVKREVIDIDGNMNHPICNLLTYYTSFNTFDRNVN